MSNTYALERSWIFFFNANENSLSKWHHFTRFLVYIFSGTSLTIPSFVYCGIHSLLTTQSFVLVLFLKEKNYCQIVTTCQVHLWQSSTWLTVVAFNYDLSNSPIDNNATELNWGWFANLHKLLSNCFPTRLLFHMLFGMFLTALNLIHFFKQEAMIKHGWYHVCTGEIPASLGQPISFW